MAYTINSAKDSRGNEDQFMARFNQNRAAIEAYKRQRGGDLEGAYQAVTGEAWPEGRSVKISHGQPEMTKDRTARSVIGKYIAAPAAIGATAAFAPGALPAIGHALGQAGSLAGHALGIGGAGAGGGLGAGAVTPGLIGGSGIAGATGGGLSLGGVLSGLGTAGKLASGMTQGRAAGRQAEANTQMDYDQMRLPAERQAMRQMLSADLLGSMKPPTDPRAQGFLNQSTVSPETIAALRAKGQAGLNGGGLRPLPQAGKTDTFLNTLGTVGQFGSLFGGRR